MARRIVTANNAEGRSYFVSNEEMESPYVWDSSAADPLGADPTGRPTYLLPSTAPTIDPPTGGSKCVRFSMQPWNVMKPSIERGEVPGLGADGFHRTATIDYLTVLSGEVDLLLDDGRATVCAGDVVVQRNTNHAWHNMTDEPTEMWGVMVRVDIE
jgi:mannose-6-phosphate isomerase-like protein (cupin superfamily)